MLFSRKFCFTAVSIFYSFFLTVKIHNFSNQLDINYTNDHITDWIETVKSVLKIVTHFFVIYITQKATTMFSSS